jgi:hypothetical protein
MLEVGRRVEIIPHLFLPLKTETSSQFNSLKASPLQKELTDELPRMSGGDGEKKVTACAGKRPWPSSSYPVTQTYSTSLRNLLGNVYVTLNI